MDGLRRYVPRDWPQAQYLAMPGIKVDVSASHHISHPQNPFSLLLLDLHYNSCNQEFKNISL